MSKAEAGWSHQRTSCVPVNLQLRRTTTYIFSDKKCSQSHNNTAVHTRWNTHTGTVACLTYPWWPDRSILWNGHAVNRRHSCNRNIYPLWLVRTFMLKLLLRPRQLNEPLNDAGWLFAQGSHSGWVKRPLTPLHFINDWRSHVKSCQIKETRAESKA